MKKVGRVIGIVLIVLIFCGVVMVALPFILTYFLYDRTLTLIENILPKRSRVGVPDVEKPEAWFSFRSLVEDELMSN